MILSFNKHVYGNELYVEEPQFSIFLPLIKNGDYEPCSIPPKLVAPTNESNLDNLVPIFTWNNGNDPSITTVYFEISHDPTFNPYNPGPGVHFSLPYEPGEQNIRHFHNLEEGLTLYWRVSFACDGGDILDSEVWSFTTPEGGTTLPAPQLLSPADGSTVGAPPFNLEWEAVPGAEEYRLLLRYRDPEDGIVKWTRFIFITETIYTIEDDDIESGPMEWSVATINDYAIGEQSEWWTFTSP